MYWHSKDTNSDTKKNGQSIFSFSSFYSNNLISFWIPFLHVNCKKVSCYSIEKCLRTTKPKRILREWSIDVHKKLNRDTERIEQWSRISMMIYAHKRSIPYSFWIWLHHLHFRKHGQAISSPRDAGTLCPCFISKKFGYAVIFFYGWWRKRPRDTMHSPIRSSQIQIKILRPPLIWSHINKESQHRAFQVAAVPLLFWPRKKRIKFLWPCIIKVFT